MRRVEQVDGAVGVVMAATALWLAACSGVPLETASTADGAASAALMVLDANRDGVLDPYEALDAMLLLEQELGRAPSTAEWTTYVVGRRAELEAEMADRLAELDVDGDGVVRTKEAGGDEGDLLEAMDDDGDGTVSLEEATAFDFAGLELASAEEIRERVDRVFREKDVDRSDSVELPREVAPAELGRFLEMDLDRDSRVSRQEAETFWKADNEPVRFDVEGTVARMTGVITSALPATVLRLLFEHREVETIEMEIVPGSIDDDANLRAALYVHQHGLATRLTSTSAIASGGTDFFLGGRQRVVAPGAVIGVHSWGGGPERATDIPRDDPAHASYLEFYETVGVPTDFYWYTLEAAPAEGMHVMTEEEIERYRLRRPAG